MMAAPSVIAGLRYASRLPQATAVKTPAITANAHPPVMTIHPAPSALVRFSKTFATTPLPSRIRIIVPMNSPNSGEVIVAVPFAKRPLEKRVQAPQHPKWDGELFVYLLFG